MDVLLETPTFGDRVAILARVAVENQEPTAEFPSYFAALEAALGLEPPPYDRESYAETYLSVSKNPRWLATSLITNAEREGDGATRLWSMAASAECESHQRLLKRHAVDESKHALIYLTLLDLAFPGAVDAEFREELNQLSPMFSMAQPLKVVEGSPYGRAPSIDDFIQMNIAEIRTTIHHLLQRQALASHCPQENQQKMNRLLDALLRDELGHVGYTAMLIEKHSRQVEAIKLSELFRKRMRDFNVITMKELGEQVYD
jgi:rubrerythrin